MKQTILGMSQQEYEARLGRRILRCVVLAALTLVLNLACVLLYSRQYHIWMLLTNIITDAACGAWLIYDISLHILPRRRLLALMGKPKQTLDGQITQVDELPIRYANMDCRAVYLGKRCVYLPVDTLTLQAGQQVELSLAANVIVEVQQ